MSYMQEPRYRVSCTLCGPLSTGTYRFREDAEGIGLRHQSEKTYAQHTISRHLYAAFGIVLDPEHAPMVERVR